MDRGPQEFYNLMGSNFLHYNKKEHGDLYYTSLRNEVHKLVITRFRREFRPLNIGGVINIICCYLKWT